MAPRTRNFVLIVLAAIVFLSVLSYVLFKAGGSSPRGGNGDPVSGLSTP